MTSEATVSLGTNIGWASLCCRKPLEWYEFSRLTFLQRCGDVSLWSEMQSTVHPFGEVLVMTAVMFEMSPTGWHTIMELSMKASMERLV